MSDRRWLVLRLEAPMLAFGGVTIDHIGVTRDFPAASMLTGFFANALGYARTDWQRHQSLQDRLIFAARRDFENPAGILLDMQNAKLEKNDKGWTTFGAPEGRDGASYSAPHRRKRDYHMDCRVTIVVSLEAEAKLPNLSALEQALDYPARPLFIGRKPCLPTDRVFQGYVAAGSAHDALCQADSKVNTPYSARALWPHGQGPESGPGVDRVIDLPDLRNWRTGLHGGFRKVVEGRVSVQGALA